MALDVNELKDVKRRALPTLMAIRGVTGVGIGDGTIRVYVLNHDVEAKLPRNVENVPLEVVVTGDIEAQ